MMQSGVWVHGGRYASSQDHPMIVGGDELTFDLGRVLADETELLILLDPLSFPFEHFGQIATLVPWVAVVHELAITEQLLRRQLFEAFGDDDVVMLNAEHPGLAGRWGLGAEQVVSKPGIAPGRPLALAAIEWLQDSTTVEITTPMGVMRGWQDDLVSRHLVEFGGHQRSDVAMLLSLVEEGDTVWDVGAHIGTVAVPLALAVGSAGKVVAVEGMATTAQLLRQNLTRDDLLAEVIVIEAIVGTSGHRRIMTLDNARNTGSARAQIADAGAGSRPRTLDELWIDQGRPSPKLVKIDVEGLEFDVLQSGAEMLRKTSPVIWLEVSGSQLQAHNNSIEDLLGRIAGQSFRYFTNALERNRGDDRFEVREVAAEDLASTIGDGLMDLAIVPSGTTLPSGWPL